MENKFITLIGDPISHSKSPSIHNTAFSLLDMHYHYDLHTANKENIKEVIHSLKEDNYVGWNVTMPVKSDMYKLCDKLSDVSMLSGAVNTVINQEGILYGTTTDGIGFLNSLKDEGIDPIGKKITILGCGGAATAIYVECALQGVKEISIFNRMNNTIQDKQNRINQVIHKTNCDIHLYDLNDTNLLKKEIDDSYLLIQATGIGMGETINQSIIDDPSLFHKGLIVADLIYSPRCTKFLFYAKEAGCKCVNGEGMLLYQAAESFKLWTNKEMPVKKLKEILNIDINV